MDALVNELSPPSRQDDFTKRMLNEFEFIGAKRCDDGTYVGLIRLFFTVAICIDVTETQAYRYRFCYDNLSDCLANYEKLDTDTDHYQLSGYVASRGT